MKKYLPALLLLVAALSGVSTIQAAAPGAVLVWGFNSQNQTVVPVAAQSGVVAIAAGRFFPLALKSDGSVVAWGNNQYGQTNVPVAAQSGVTAVSGGGEHAVALKSDG